MCVTIFKRELTPAARVVHSRIHMSCAMLVEREVLLSGDKAGDVRSALHCSNWSDGGCCIEKSSSGYQCFSNQDSIDGINLSLRDFFNERHF